VVASNCLFLYFVFLKFYYLLLKITIYLSLHLIICFYFIVSLLIVLSELHKMPMVVLPSADLLFKEDVVLLHLVQNNP
jgi:hypothetical protein